MKRRSIHIKRQLHRLARSHWALSTVVTTLIILVISVLLASVVTYFAINVVSTRVQEESLALTKQHIWYSADGTQAALMIINTGGRDVVIQKFAIRGQTVDWKNVYYATTDKAVSADLPCNTAIAAGSHTIGGVALTFAKASDSLTLRSGYSMVLYINSPDSITINDVGLTVSITLNTVQAMYYVEANVQSTSGTQSVQATPDPDSPSGSGSFEITSVIAMYYPGDDQNAELSFVILMVHNGGSDPVVITKDDLIVRGVQVLSGGLIVGDEHGNPIVCESCTTQPGVDRAIYFLDTCTYITQNDVGKTISIGLNLGNSQIGTTQVKVGQSVNALGS